MPESTKVQGIGAYANLCLTVIAGCLIYLCYRTTTTDAHPTKVEIVKIASKLDTPMPCKLMFKKKSTYSTQWTDEGRLGVQLAGGDKPKEFMRVEIVGVASNIRNPLPIKAKQEEKGRFFGSAPSNDGAIAVRLVGIEKGYGKKWDAIPAQLVGIERPEGLLGNWHAIPVRGPALMSGESGGLIGSYPVEVQVAP